MTLNAGTRLGPYEIVSPIGAGGMGEVYKAKDARLGRDVAIKVLPSHLIDDPDLKARFEREARAISQLTHPHICTLYDVGNADGVEYLVMELLEGQTLADRVEKGPLSTDQVIRFGMEIADALDRAHRAGIVHRDLKPGNVMLTKSGVKLLDFGLAKTAASERGVSDLSSLPTELGASRPLTQKGTVMGTFQYMAPEQLEGKDADARTDIFALGCVLYEMATGKKAFTGASQASLVSSILRDEPMPISQIAPMAPPALDRLVKTCLAKDPEERWQSARDVMSELRWIGQAGSQAGAPAVVVTRRKNREKLAWGIAAAALAGVAVLTTIALRRHEAPAAAVRFEVSPPPETRFGYGLAISPDGSQLVFEGASIGKQKLYLRRLSSTEVKELPGTEGAVFPFWSPDGTRLGFFTAGTLKRYDLATGSAQTLAPAANGRGGTWSRDGVILFAPDTGTGISRVSADGGAVALETTLDPHSQEGSHRWPYFLPDGRHYLYMVRGAAAGKPGIYAGTLGSKKRRFVAEANSAMAYSPPGLLLYIRQKALVAQNFDAGSLETKGAPFPVVADMEALGDTQPTGYVRMSVSDNGVLAVRSGVSSVSQFAWLDREGKKLSTVGSASEQDEPTLSPDEKYVVFERNDPAAGTNDLWRLDLERGVESRLTYDSGSENTAIWLPDCANVIYSSGGVAGLQNELIQINASGTGDKRVLVHSTEGSVYPDAVSPDGKLLMFEQQTQKGSIDLMLVPISEGGKPLSEGGKSLSNAGKSTAFLASPFDEAHAQFSPDGRFVSYTSSESGRDEIYVRPFPSGPEKWQVSASGGDQATWKADGTELYYLSAQQEIMAVPVAQKPAGLSFGAPKTLFAVRVPAYGVTLSRTGFQVSRDGTRFLVNAVTGGTDRSPITVALNWTADIKR
jgi:Tol biopolymer transport system component/tRNA A-37 threonylcarbamoyl transferase component Bud32